MLAMIWVSGHQVLFFIYLLRNANITGKSSHACLMTSSNGNIFRVTGHLCGEFTGPRWIPAQRPVMRSFDVFFDPRLNKLNKQWWGWWFEAPSHPLWCHCNDKLAYQLNWLTDVHEEGAVCDCLDFERFALLDTLGLLDKKNVYRF